jgi:integrase
LFAYAKAQKYLPKDHDELEAVGRAKNRDGEIEIFTPAELLEIFSHAKEEIMPFLLVGAFAGVRHIEIQRLVWEDIRLDDGLIEIRAKNAKTASRRMIPVVPTLKEWLLKYRQDTGPVCDYNNVGFACWGGNKMRLAGEQNETQLLRA